MANLKLVAAMLLVISLTGLYFAGAFEPQTKTLVAKHSGFVLEYRPLDNMTNVELADNIHAGKYSAKGGYDNCDSADKGIPVSSYIIWEDIDAFYHDNDKRVVAQGGKALLKYEWGDSPIAWGQFSSDADDPHPVGTVGTETYDNITIERL